MSFFQYYEFYKIDSSLSTEEIEEVSSWSSRARVLNRRAVFTYSYGDFPFEPKEILLDYFDAFFYADSGGSIHLMFKMPKKLVNVKQLQQYDILEDWSESELKISTHKDMLVIEATYRNVSDNFGWIEEDLPWLANILSVREAILNGDYTTVFMIWMSILKEKYENGKIEATFQIPQALLPPKLCYRKNKALLTLMEIFEIDKDWLNTFVDYSNQKTATLPFNAKEKLDLLPLARKNEFLTRLLDGEILLGQKLTRVLQELNNTITHTAVAEGTILMSDYLAKLNEYIATREQREKAEKARLHKLKMEETAARKEQIVASINANILIGKAQSYDQLFKDMLLLQELAVYQNKTAEFDAYLTGIKQQYSRRSGLLRRLNKIK
jgi:hypothetical protein